MSSPMNASSSHVLRKSAAQWPNQIRLYHSTVQQSPCFAFKWYVQFLCYCFSAVSLIIDTHCLKKKEKENLTTRIFSKCWKKSKWSQQLDLKKNNNNIAAYFIASLCYTCICRPLVLSWTQTGALLNLISLTWALNKKACGSAGCPPMEARTRVNSPSLLKVSDLRHFKVLYRQVNFKIIKKDPASFQCPRCPLLLPNCWKREASSCWWCQCTPLWEMAPSSQSESSISLWRIKMKTCGPPS